MKKLVFGLIATALISLSSFSQNKSLESDKDFQDYISTMNTLFTNVKDANAIKDLAKITADKWTDNDSENLSRALGFNKLSEFSSIIEVQNLRLKSIELNHQLTKLTDNELESSLIAVYQLQHPDVNLLLKTPCKTRYALCLVGVWAVGVASQSACFAADAGTFGATFGCHLVAYALVASLAATCEFSYEDCIDKK
jgi:hypothetical protein